MTQDTTSNAATPPFVDDAMDDAIDQALGWPTDSEAIQRRNLEQRIEVGWCNREPLWSIAAATGLHFHDVMDVVRALNLSERTWNTRELLEPLPPELTAH